MPVEDKQRGRCTECGTRLDGAGFSCELGRCMVCLLRIGFETEPSDPANQSLPDRFGTYKLERRDDGTLWELGRGAMGVTYRALDTSLQRPVALKLIDSEWIKRGAEARERFMREARAAAALRHPNVATVYQFGIQEQNGQYFCAIELVEGETLEMRVRRTGPLDALITIEIALQVSAALAAAEKQGLVHRDLKPANLMLVTDESDKSSLVVKVIDFGVAKALAEKPDAMGLTHGGFVGTPAFASPEQFTNTPVDVRSDIYSLGATLWYLLTGQMPFVGASVEEIRASHESHALPLEQLKGARVPARLASLVASMLASEPAARPGIRPLTLKLRDCRAQILDRWKTARRIAVAAGVIGLATSALLLFSRSPNPAISRPATQSNISDKSIAVLPFENLDQDPANTFFADGIQDDLLTSLAKIKDLKVISRTSVMSYRDKGRRNLREIGQELGVAHVLEGSVRRVANRVLLNVQLIDTASDHHLWAERYDRTVADAISLQGELASEIAMALGATLSPPEKSRLESKATDNPEAYVSYLRARELQLRYEVSREQLLTAESLYKQAIAFDPRFVLARARLSWVQAMIHDRYEYANPARLAEARPRLEEARTNAEEALRLDPDSAEAHQALGWCAQLAGDKALAKVETEAAVDLRPNDAAIRAAVASIQQELGLLEEATANYKRAIELSPREARIVFNYGNLLANRGKQAEAREALDRGLALAPESIFYRLSRAREEVAWTGDTGRARKILAGLPPGQDPEGRVTSAYCALAFFERNFGEARRLLEAYPGKKLPPPQSGGTGEPFPKAYVEGQIAVYSGDREHAFDCFDAARWEWEVDVRDKPLSPEDHGGLAAIYAWMGWKEAAMSEVAREVALEKAAAVAAKDRHPFELARSFNRAQTYGWLGELDLAFAQLEEYATDPRAWYTAHNFRLDPIWDPLRGDPRFEKIVASLAPKEAPSPSSLPEKSIAVLPFENRSEDKDNAFFADGMQDDVLTSLVKIKELKVIGRSSVMSYRDVAKRNLRAIGQDLGVAYVLEGSVQRVADRTLIFVNLTDTRDGRAVWAERYDRKLPDLSGLQGELAIEIASVLRARLAPAEKASLQTRTTENPDAYVFYLRGREYQMRPETSQENYQSAENFYKQAITLDPRFALARARLAVIQNNLWGFFDHRPERIAEARRNAEEAVRLDPNSGQAHMALAVTRGSGGTPEEMKREIEIAVRLLPNDAYIAMDAATYLYNLGAFDDAVTSYERAILLNPREGKTFYNYGVALYEHNEIPRARSALDRALELSPESVYFRLFRAKAEIEWTGDLARGKAILADLPKGKDPDGRVTAAHCSIALWERNLAEVFKLLAACPLERIPFFAMGFGQMVPKNFIQGMVQFYAGDRGGAYATLDSARWMLEVEAENADDTDAIFSLALAYAALGWNDAAKEQAARVKEKLGDLWMAVLSAHLGEIEPAVTALERAALKPDFQAERVYLRWDPDWDGLRNDPRFEKILAAEKPAIVDQ